MTETTTRKRQILHRHSGRVLFECEVPDIVASGMAMRHALEQAVQSGADLRYADLSGANLSDADLRYADLSGANLTPIKTDVFDILLRAPGEVAGLRAALAEGRVDGSVYEGECACLVGTIANVRGVLYTALGAGIVPNGGRPAESWFMNIRKGDTAESNQVVAITLGWVDEFLALLAAARGLTAPANVKE